MPGVPWHTQILADQLTLFQPGGTDYAHLITTGTPDFQTFRRPWSGVLVFTNIDFLGTFLDTLLLNTDNIVYRSQNSKIKESILNNTKQKNFENGAKT